MNLNKAQKAHWATMNSIFTALASVKAPEDAIRAQMATWIDHFDAMTEGNAKVKIRLGDTPELELIDCSKDYARVNDTAREKVLRARIHGIQINANVAYKDSYAHRNDNLADAFREVARLLDALPFDVRDRDAVEILQELGISHSDADDTLIIDGPKADDDVEAPVVAAVAEEAPATDESVVLVSISDEEAAAV